MNNILPNDREQLLLPMNPEKLQNELLGYPSVGYYVRELLKDYQAQDLPTVEALHKLTSLIRLPEASVSRPSSHLAEQYFFIGGVIGLRAIELAKGATFANQLYDAQDSLPVPDLSRLVDRDAKLRVVARSIMNASDEGYLLAESYHKTVDYIASKLCVVAADQPFVRRGFGLTMFMTAESLLRNDDIAGKVDRPMLPVGAEELTVFDWNRGLITELGGGA